jgi:predicted RNase H-like nuclease
LTLVAGADGCPAGWLCVLLDSRTGAPVSAFIARDFAALIARDDISHIAVDIPIGVSGFADNNGRGCDKALRSVLGGRQSSVFAVPARAALEQQDYRAACEAAFAHSDPPRKVSKQCFHLFPKIREVDALMTPQLQSRVSECHPEGAFWAMNGNAALSLPKKVKSKAFPAGLAERRALLLKAGFSEGFLDAQQFRRAEAGADDFLDACACAWSARRIVRDEATRFPEQPLTDPRGLRMEICV